MTPAENLRAFINDLPSMTAEAALTQVVMAIDRDSMRTTDRNAEPWATTAARIISMHLAENDDVTRIVIVAALFDYAFARPMLPPDAIKALAETSDVFKSVALRAPLADRQFQQARAKWSRLRSGPLSLDALHEYERSQIAAIVNKLQPPI